MYSRKDDRGNAALQDFRRNREERDGTIVSEFVLGTLVLIHGNHICEFPQSREVGSVDRQIEDESQ